MDLAIAVNCGTLNGCFVIRFRNGREWMGWNWQVRSRIGGKSSSPCGPQLEQSDKFFYSINSTKTHERCLICRQLIWNKTKLNPVFLPDQLCSFLINGKCTAVMYRHRIQHRHNCEVSLQQEFKWTEKAEIWPCLRHDGRRLFREFFSLKINWAILENPLKIVRYKADV